MCANIYAHLLPPTSTNSHTVSPTPIHSHPLHSLHSLATTSIYSHPLSPIYSPLPSISTLFSGLALIFSPLLPTPTHVYPTPTHLKPISVQSCSILITVESTPPPPSRYDNSHPTPRIGLRDIKLLIKYELLQSWCHELLLFLEFEMNVLNQLYTFFYICTFFTFLFDKRMWLKVG